ncbi:signal peptidase complex catalytic subunit SEC11, partial [Striga asiatica]
MGWVGEQIDSIKSLNFRQALTQAVSLGMIVTSALIIWKGLMCITGSESPVVVVLSGSMEPGFKRGDILFLHFSKDPIRAGEIVVFNVDGREIPIVHRVIKSRDSPSVPQPLHKKGKRKKRKGGESKCQFHRKVHERQDSGEVDVLTKGDNNFGDDRLLYANGQLWLHRHHIMGRAVGFLPYVGWVTIIMTEKPIIKYILIGALGLLGPIENYGRSHKQSPQSTFDHLHFILKQINRFGLLIVVATLAKIKSLLKTAVDKHEVSSLRTCSAGYARAIASLKRADFRTISGGTYVALIKAISDANDEPRDCE